MPKLKGSLSRDDEIVYQGNLTIEEANEPVRKAIGFRKQTPTPPKLTGFLYSESLPTFKKGDVLRLKLSDRKEADVVIDRITKVVDQLYATFFILKSPLK
jgi:hypothetical protein